jgi:MFS family permease
MNLKLRLTILSFLQFFVWGAWLITMANFWFGTKHWDGAQFGAVFGTMGIASIFMPTITGIIADRWVNAERIFQRYIFYMVLCFSFCLTLRIRFFLHGNACCNVFLHAYNCISQFNILYYS